jgi:hypothetical protein
LNVKSFQYFGKHCSCHLHGEYIILVSSPVWTPDQTLTCSKTLRSPRTDTSSPMRKGMRRECTCSEGRPLQTVVCLCCLKTSHICCIVAMRVTVSAASVCCWLRTSHNVVHGCWVRCQSVPAAGILLSAFTLKLFLSYYKP